jgi:hypothetical protein
MGLRELKFSLSRIYVHELTHVSGSRYNVLHSISYTCTDPTEDGGNMLLRNTGYMA